MHVFQVHLLFVQVFFIVNTHASYACISCTLAFLYKYFLSSIHMLLMHAFHVHLLFCASFFFFFRQYTCFLCMYFMYTCFFVQVLFIVNTHASYACISRSLAFLCKYFFRIVIWTMITSLRVFFIWKLKIGRKRIMMLAVFLLFRQHFEWK